MLLNTQTSTLFHTKYNDIDVFGVENNENDAVDAKIDDNKQFHDRWWMKWFSIQMDEL